MRYVTVPEDVVLCDPLTGKELEPKTAWSLHRFLVLVVLPDPAVGKGYAADMARFTVETSFRDAKPGDVVCVESEHWNMIKGAIENPSGEFNPVLRVQLLPFQRAFIDAPDIKK